MRKVLWVVIGLAVVLGAVGFATNRHVIGPQRSVSISSSQQAPAGARRTAPAPAPAPSGWATFDTVINILNVVVGIAGIWMTFHGMRMQRAALNAQAHNRH